MLCIHESVTGAGRHLICESSNHGFQWTSDIPHDAWILGPCDRPTRSLHSLALAHGVSIKLNPGGKYASSAGQLLGHDPLLSEIAWRHYMTAHDFKSYVTELVMSAFSVMTLQDTDYYLNVYLPMMEFLGSLTPPRIDRSVYNEHVLTNVSPALRTFVPDHDGLAAPIVYTKFRTKTGRLIVASGPDILTLPRDCRDIIVSRDPSGAIAYVDYSSMEPRLVLGLAGREVAGDLYIAVGETVGKPRAPRDRLKLTVTSVLYGAGVESVARTMDCSLRAASEISGRIDDYFNAGDLRRRLEVEYEAQGFVRNLYGKRVYPDNASLGLLLNNFAQSSAVDGAILGFQRGTHEAGDGIKTLFVLHDASFVDVTSRPALRRFVAGAERIPGISVKMPLSIQRIGGKHD